MRPKVVLTLMALAALVLVAAFRVKQHFAQLRPEALSETATLPLPAANADLAVASNFTSKPMRPPVAVIVPAVAMTPEQRQAYIEDKISRLQEFSTKRDPASFSAILNDLTNSEKEVRFAAIEATKQVGSRDAIPALKADVANSPNIDEQVALLEAAEFLSLPTIADSDVQQPKTADQIQAAQQRRYQAAARRQARMQQRTQYQDSQLPSDQNSQADSNN